MTGLLQGIRVVETGVLMGVDNLGRLLGDEGADVVKVESPQLGDYLRNIMTRFAPDWSMYHVALNRNKRSVTVDARTAQGRALMARLVSDADVFITGNVGATNERLGLGYATLHALNPRLVYCQVTGFGASGPYAEIPTHGQMMDQLGARTPQLELADGATRTVPGSNSPDTLGVVVGPLHAAFGVASALVRRSITGTGCYLDVSCADAVLAARWLDAIRELNPQCIDSTGPTANPAESAKYQNYQTSDGKFVLFCAIEAKFWDHFCSAVDRADLCSDHRRDLVVDFAGGDENALLRVELQRIFHTRTLTEWMALAAEHDIAIGPALQLAEVRDDPHLIARGMIVAEHHPTLGDFDTLGNPLHTPGESFVLRSAPSLGEHTDEVLAELGYDDTARAALRADGVIR